MNDKEIQSLKENLGLELEVIHLYQEYVQQARDPAVRRILLQLIDESMRHADGFKKILYKETLGIDYGKQGISDASLTRLLEVGMKEERGMRMYYEKQLAALPEGEYKAFLAKTIEDEKRHEQMLKQVYGRIGK